MNGPAPPPFEGLARLGKGRARYLWLVGLGLYLLAIWFLGWRDLGEALWRIDLRFIAALMALDAAALWVRVLKWRIALGPGQRSTALCFLSKAGGNLTPGRVGELSPLLLPRHRTAKIGAWIVMDRLLEAGTTLTLGLVGLFAVSLTQRNALLPWIAGVLVCVAAVAYGLTRQRLLNRIAHAVREGSLLQRGLGILASMSVEMVRFGSKAPLLAAITFVAKCMDVAVSFLLYLSFVAWVPLAVLALAQCVHVLTSMVPITPNATGIPYAATAAFLYQVVGVTPEVLAVAIPVRVIAGSLVFWPSLWLGMFVVGRPPRFENQGALFDKLAAGTVLYDYRPEALAKIKALAEAKGAVRRKGPVLVVGCGDGAVGQMLKGDPVVGVEISPRCAALSRDRGLRCALADVVRGLPFAEASFQSVICIDVLHHLGGDWERLFAEFDRVLQRGGTLFLVEPDARNLFVRWTQAPGSPIRVAPWHNEPAIDPGNLIPHLERMGYTYECESFHLEGRQKERSVFPFWQRVLKAPFVLALAYGYRSKPNKFALVTRKPT